VSLYEIADSGLTRHEPAASVNDNALRRFREIEEELPGLLDRLLACPPHRAGVRPTVPKVAGVYLFTEGSTHRYVGRSRNCNRRLGEHTRPSSQENSAPFAFNIAKQEAERSGKPVAGTREAISIEATFAPLFAAAKARVRGMDYRYVPVDNPAISTIFEVYAAIALGTEGDFNRFETS
jgi:hypothetical protein